MAFMFARAVAALCLLFSLWDALHLGTLTVFDCLLPLAIASAFLAPHDHRAFRMGDLWLVVAGQAFTALGAILAASAASSPAEHAVKSLVIILAMLVMFSAATVFARRRLLSFSEVVFILAASATVCSFVAILQGWLGLLTWISPFNAGFQFDRRSAGLAQHPIEAGAIGCLGVMLSLFLAIKRSQSFSFRILLILMTALNAFSMVFTASLTAFGALILGVLIQLAFDRRFGMIAGLVLLGPFALVPQLMSNKSQLSDRLAQLFGHQGNYATLQLRQAQWSETIDRIHGSYIVTGNGYSSADLPQGIEIHNALLASLYHFGMFGLIGQLCLCALLLKRLAGRGQRDIRGLLAGVLVIFFAEYLTGPVFSHRSNWITAVVITCYMPLMAQRPVRATLKDIRRQSLHVWRSRSSLTAPSSPSQPV